MRRFFVASALLFALALAAERGSEAAPSVGFTAPGQATLVGETLGPSVFNVAGVARRCELKGFSGSVEGDSPTLAPIPQFGDCTAQVLSELPVKWVTAECAWVLERPDPIGGGRWESSVDLTCPGELPMEWNVYETPQGYLEGAVVCATEMSPQRRIGTAVISQSGSGLRIRWNLDQFRYRAYGFELLCGSKSGVTKQDASYRATTVLHAEDERGRPVPLGVGG